ncbi:MAG: carcinine hydrolase/isopenicillin-N N-acyltransferase family protein [Alphaproteobacteria bacterium]
METVLPEIPVERLGKAGLDQLADRQRDRQRALLKAGRKKLTRPGLAFLDHRSRSWSRRTENPYHDEIAAIDADAPAPGTWFMNFCYEWGCTAGLKPTGGAPTLLRTLDWPFDHVGQGVVVAEREAAAGPYWLVTWPGHVGAITVMAPGRFSIAINQAPMRRRSPVKALDWLLDRAMVNASRGLPPAHLVRRVADSAATFEDAVDMLSRTEIALPVIFSVAGMTAEASIVLERTQTGCSARRGMASAANHWAAFTMPQRDRGHHSQRRQDDMQAYLNNADADPHSLAWLKPPILNADTRLATVMDLAAGKLTVQGLEADGPATRILHLTH